MSPEGASRDQADSSESNPGSCDEKNGWGSEVLKLYDSFVLRDLFGYIAPGALLLWTFAGVLGIHVYPDSRLFGSSTDLFPEAKWSDPQLWAFGALGIASCYVAGIALRLIGTVMRLTVLHINPGLLGNPWTCDADRDRNGWPSSLWAWLVTWMWKGKVDYRSTLEEWYGSLFRVLGHKRAKPIVDREIMFLHVTGNGGVALLICGLVELLSGDPRWPIGLLAVALALLLFSGHYRHARQIRLMVSILDTNGRAEQEGSGDVAGA